MAIKPKKLSDKMEAEIRAQFLPAQLQGILEQIMAIDFNAAWRQTPEGIKDAKENDLYDADQLAAVLIKQQEHKEVLLPKLAFIKKLIDKNKGSF